MGKKNSRRNQKLYKMKGYSKTRKNYLGGKTTTSNLAITPNNSFFNNKTGGACSAILTPANGSVPQNINGANPAYPSSGPVPTGFNFLNPQSTQKGGSCGCGLPLMSGGGKVKKGGSCGQSCGLIGGSKHRVACKCSMCKMKGGMGNNGIPYPDGLVGHPWTPAISGWPGVDGIQGDRNYLAYNNYNVDPQTATIYTGANPPFSIGGKAKSTRKKRQYGGYFSNSIAQDFINVGRQFQYGLGTAYNALAGYQAPVNPMPWKGQLPATASLSTLKAAYST